MAEKQQEQNKRVRKTHNPLLLQNRKYFENNVIAGIQHSMSPSTPTLLEKFES